jgi:hypothetical protein
VRRRRTLERGAAPCEKSRVRRFAVRRALLPLLAACSLACSTRPESAPFVLRIAVIGPLAKVHPDQSETNSAMAGDLAFDAVLYPDRDGRPRSRIARAVERLGPNRYRIAVDPAARFSDGAPVTYEDVARAVAQWHLKVTRDGEWIVLDSPDGAIEAKLFYSAIGRESGGRWIGTRPYRIVEEGPWRVALERVAPASGRIQRVELVAFPTPRDALARTLRGETNGVTQLSEEQAEFLDGIPSLRLTRTAGPQARSIFFNRLRLEDADWSALRRALPLARIAPLACTRPELVNPALPATAGTIPPGPPLSIASLIPDSQSQLVALALRRALGPRGGALARPDPGAPTSRLGAADRDISVTNLLAWPPVVLALTWGTGAPFNAIGYSNPAVDAAFARGDAAGAAAEIERSAPYVALCRNERIAAFDARVKNASLGWWGILDTLPDWEVEP